MDQHILNPICSTNPIVYLDINIGPEFAGRMIIELRKDVVPKSAENFRALCTGEYGIGQFGKPLHYKGVRFHKVTRVFVVQSGDIVNNDGTSGESIYGPIFEDENFILPHEEGVVSLTNYGKPNTNNSQFVITSAPCYNLNGTNVVIGRVLRGLGIIAEMEKHSTDDGQPIQDIVIADCNEITSGEGWGFEDNDETEDKLPPYPQDWDSKLNNFTSNEAYSILMSIRNAGNFFYKHKRYYDARRKYRKATRYCLLFRQRYIWQELPQNEGSDRDLKRLDSFSVINNINMAAVELELGNYVNVKNLCTEAIRLDAQCGKAFYRRGQAQSALKNFEEAIEDFNTAQMLIPENKKIVSELHKVKRMLGEYNRSQMKIYKNIFN